MNIPSIILIITGYLFSIIFSGDYFQAFKTSSKYLLFPLILAFAVLYFSKKKPLKKREAIVFTFPILITISAILIKPSEPIALTAVISCLAFLIATYFKDQIKKPNPQKIIKIALISIFVIYAGLVPVKYVLNKNNTNNSNKLQNIATSFYLSNTFPISGIGVNEFKNIYSQKNNHAFTGLDDQNSKFPNNIFFTFWLNFGLPGLIGFASLILIASRKISPAFLALSTIIIIGQWSNVYFQISSCILIWFYLFLSLNDEK